MKMIAPTIARRPIFTLLAACAAIAATAPASQAGLLSGVAPGLLSPAVSAACTASSQPFAAWGDRSWYQLAPGGSFENGPAWSGAATVVDGNESFSVGGADDSRSLLIPRGSTVTSASACFAAGDLKLRFFAKGMGRVRVTVVVRDLLGLVSTLDGGVVTAGPGWQPTPPVSLAVTSLGALVSTDAIQLRLTPLDGAVQVDDVYVDPYKGT
jgi:hypothetical protein